MSDAFTPVPEDHFTFGLWTVGNPGRDPFGHEVRAPARPRRLGEAPGRGGGVRRQLPRRRPRARRFERAERDAIVARFRGALDETGLRVPMATCNLFSQPVFRDGAFTANDVQVRRFALAKTLDAIDLGVELGAEIFVMWGGREGCEVDAAMDIARRARPLRRGGEPRVRVRRSSRDTDCGSRSSRSPTSRAATSSSRRWGTCSRSSTSSSIRRWWG